MTDITRPPDYTDEQYINYLENTSNGIIESRNKLEEDLDRYELIIEALEYEIFKMKSELENAANNRCSCSKES